MPQLHIDLFAASTDPEAARYRVLAGLQEADAAFRQNRVFPHLADLVRLRQALGDLLDGVDRFRSARPGRVVDVDWEAGRVVHDPEAEPLLAEGLARWALPNVDQALEAGRTLFEFAAAHARLAPVGVVPAYRAEGFLVVPTDGDVLVYRYAVSALVGDDGGYRGLRTAAADVALDPLAPPAEWKRALAAAHPDLPSPATFWLDCSLPLPAEPTTVPIAKRKLLGQVSWGDA